MYKSSSFAAIIIILSTQRIKGNLIENNPLCISSSPRPYEINTTSFIDTRKEGKCLVACLDRFQNDIMNRDFIRPFPVINETAGCLPHLDKVYSCVKGCVEFNFISRCPCLDGDCTECKGCLIPEAKRNIWTSQAGCRTNCYINSCQIGCNIGEKFIFNQHHRLQSQPEFQMLNHSHGNDQYLVSLESTGLTPGNFATTFLFQITDTDSRNISYVWQHDWRKPLNLSGYSCRTVNVTLILIANDSNTTFDAVEIQVGGDYSKAILTNFTCQKEIDVYSQSSLPEAYFKFDLQWTTLPKFVDFIQNFSIDYKVYDNRTNTVINEAPTRYAMNNSFSMSYTNLSHPRTDSEELYLFELKIYWKDGTVQEKPYTCTLSGQSPTPAPVPLFVVTKSHVLDHEVVEVSANWSPPPEANGVLVGYRLCLSRQPLEDDEKPLESDSFCLNVSSEHISITAKMKSNNASPEDNRYLQIQPLNKYSAGPWSQGIPVSIEKKSQEILIGAIVTCLVSIFVALVILLIYLTYRYCAHRKQVQCTEANILPMRGIKSAQIIASFQEPLYEQKDKWEVMPSNVTLDEELGHGQFGTVIRGRLFQNSKNGDLDCIPVAIKLLKADNAVGSVKKRFLLEIEIMKKLSKGHNPHVVAMKGCVTTQEPMCLITELVEFGDLLSYLRNIKNCIPSSSPKLAEDEILNFSYQIADGMEYISSMGILHRDLACRNILVDKGKVLKITDFGLSHECSNLEICSDHQVPLKWMPLEYIGRSEFAFPSDVWSFGIVLWEIATLGETPYKRIRNKDLLLHLTAGYRLEIPENTSSTICQIMKSCWLENPLERPTFHALKQKFNDILVSKNEYLYLHEASTETKNHDIDLSDNEITPSINDVNDSNLPRSVSWNLELKIPPITDMPLSEKEVMCERKISINHSKSLGFLNAAQHSMRTRDNCRLHHLSINCEPRYCLRTP